MVNAKRDGNNVTTLLSILNTDGITLSIVKINPVNKGLKVDNNTTGSDLGPNRALHDENSVTTIQAVSNSDGSTIIPLYVNSTGNLLIDAT